MNQANLATLERVDVRCAWPNEAQDFTPWLANNLGVLSDELGVALELEDTEKAVGLYRYRADIVARVHTTALWCSLRISWRRPTWSTWAKFWPIWLG